MANTCVCMTGFLDTTNNNACVTSCGNTRYGDPTTLTCLSCSNTCAVIYFSII